ncbi:MAG: hypothetical protein ACE14M_07240, partial [Terriglobales bacterium]
LNHRPLGYEPNELPDCSTPRIHYKCVVRGGQGDPRSRRTIALRTVADQEFKHGKRSTSPIQGQIIL